MPSPHTIETDRLVLRQWIETDRDPFAVMCADPAVMEFFPATLSRAESDAMVDHVQAHIDEKNWGLWAVEGKSDGSFLGFVGLHPTSLKLPFPPTVEIGWRLAKSAWGKGFATEAANECLKFGFEEISLGEIVSFTAVPNLRSVAVMRRIGLRDRQEVFEHPALPPGHALRDHVLYGLTAGEWGARRNDQNSPM